MKAAKGYGLMMIVISVVVIIFSACGGGGGGGGSTTPTAPYIGALAITWAGGAPPSGFPALQVRVCADRHCNTPITNAIVTINNNMLLYNSTDLAYEDSGHMPAPNAVVNLSVTIPSGGPAVAGTYASSGTQYATFPSGLTTGGANWPRASSNTVDWNGGSPTAASDYVVGIFDGLGNFYPTNPNNNPVTVSTTLVSYTLPANSIANTGPYSVFVGIGTSGVAGQTSGGISIPNAAAGSGLWIAGVSSIVQVNVI